MIFTDTILPLWSYNPEKWEFKMMVLHITNKDIEYASEEEKALLERLLEVLGRRFQEQIFLYTDSDGDLWTMICLQ